MNFLGNRKKVEDERCNVVADVRCGAEPKCGERRAKISRTPRQFSNNEIKDKSIHELRP
jgi:hypothetical protein